MKFYCVDNTFPKMYGVLCQSGKLFLRRLICNANTNDRTRILRLSSTDVTSLYDEIEANKNRKRTKVQRLTRKTFEKYLQTKLNCPVDVATNIWFAHRELSDIHLTNVESNVDLLTGKGVAIKQILELPSLLSLSTGNLEHRLHILESMKPHKIEDFVPLAIVDDMQLNQIRWTAEREKKLIPSRHRIYHFSELLEMTPYTISKYVSNRLYMLHMPFADVDQRIRTLLTYKTPEQIVANLWIIRYSETALELMGRARRAEPKKETFSMTEHYAKRLECDIAEVENLMKLYPFLATMDVMKLDRRLDFLLEEIGVEASTIISVPRILMKSVDMMKERFYELESLGYGCQGHQQMMIKVSLSNSRYAKFLAELKSQPRKDESNNYLVRKWTDFRKLFH